VDEKNEKNPEPSQSEKNETQPELVHASECTDGQEIEATDNHLPYPHSRGVFRGKFD